MRRGRGSAPRQPGSSSSRLDHAVVRTAATAMSKSKTMQKRVNPASIRSTHETFSEAGRRERDRCLPRWPAAWSSPSHFSSRTRRAGDRQSRCDFSTSGQPCAVSAGRGRHARRPFFRGTFPAFRSVASRAWFARASCASTAGAPSQGRGRNRPIRACAAAQARGAQAPRRCPAAQKDRDFLRSITLYEDDDMLVLNKPRASPCRAARAPSGMSTACSRRCAAPSRRQRPRLVHRLDRDTSGFSSWRRRVCRHELAGTFRTRSARKIYWALVAGVPKPPRAASRPASPSRGGGATCGSPGMATRTPATPSPITRWSRRRPEARLALAPAGHRPHPSVPRPHGAYRPPDHRRSEIFRPRELGTAGRHAEQAASARAPHRVPHPRGGARRHARRCRRICSSPGTCSASTPSATIRSSTRRRRSSGCAAALLSDGDERSFSAHCFLILR